MEVCLLRVNRLMRLSLALLTCQGQQHSIVQVHPLILTSYAILPPPPHISLSVAHHVRIFHTQYSVTLPCMTMCLTRKAGY